MSAQPTRPVLASTLHASLQVASLNAKASTGFQDIDQQVLEGGFEYGKDNVVSISAGSLITSDLALSILAHHLHTHTTAPAFYIDAVGVFSPIHLHSILTKLQRKSKGIASGFIHKGGYVYEAVSPGRGHGVADPARTLGTRDVGEATADTDGVDEPTVEEMMARVKVMRVFDYMGAMEAIEEVRTSLGAPRKGEESYDPEHNDDTQAKEEVIHDAQKLEIADSEDGNSELNLDEDTGHEVDSRAIHNIYEVTAASPLFAQSVQSHSPYILILNALPQLINPLAAASHTRGQALLTHLVRTLRHISAAYNGCAILINSVVGLRMNESGSVHGKRRGFNRADGGAGSGHTEGTVIQEGVSVFAVNGDARPALGRTLRFLVDVEILLTEREGEKGDILEILSDRAGRRTGRWGVLGR